ncbi:MAG: cyclodeaminase/cyclohydrolase family protein [Negativicoccus massiliensis]|uniref:cyclodeaminase/cyclohydrolase family protein n=1 Tax=Negativicoccus succinicivorans TaxID=620903 RepID=UPI0026ED07BB|nr:cyclodeaminase/cyclohydrolase family protein [Negativicoccus succinicivorans]MBS5887567.1 cyclodeaminase/cyclohydrolase family protein [Negativicoccus succinicivorans]MDU0826762.1 cyclodeaminase/cyclohydrolase family protein [Negativicoccus succinicivorans]MDU3214781.1 cyclodeaminase/cyclohydrolase family protein [Negativicoccus succinicivorans]MDU4641646.1 cyclodeaminase/cyclohydrolase family protein [Negativicoccus massiliensis]
MNQPTQMTLAEFTAALASAAPTPGGGGASALVGAQAVALAQMVAELTLKNERYADAHEDMQAVRDEAERLRAEVLSYIQKDADAFGALVVAWRLPKDDPSRAARNEAATRAAAEVPLALAEACARIFPLAAQVLAKGVASARSDGELAVLFAAAAIRGALYNVRINIKNMPENEYTKLLITRQKTLATQAEQAERELLGGV